MPQIPKIIHYCWFGGNQLPELAVKCIASWEKFFPDYEIKQWDESKFDIDIIPYTSQAYKARKYAFVSDYARFWILYKYGGIYFDTDVEVIKSMNEIIDAGSFMGSERPYNKNNGPEHMGINPGLGLGSTPNNPIYKEILESYANRSFITNNGHYNTTTVVTYTTDILCRHGLKNSPHIQCIDNINIYPMDYFCPINYETNKLTITDNTVSIHHYSASWHGPMEKIYVLLSKIFGKKFMKSIKSSLYRK